MFRIDEHRVIDATIRGNIARFFNHSCVPNCKTEIITIDNEIKVIIFAVRGIKNGEELTYNYFFEVEKDTTKKILCCCQMPLCQKYLN